LKTLQLIFAVAILSLAGCGNREILEPRGSRAPPGVDFSGTWVISEKDSDTQSSIRRAIYQTDGGKVRESRPRPAHRRGKHSGLVDVFLETGRMLKITQTPYGFFISVDRSVVEEFSFGEQRTVSVGKIVAQRVSGWDGNVYVVETLDENGMKLTERFSVEKETAMLRREITFRSRKDKSVTVIQRFNELQLNDSDIR